MTVLSYVLFTAVALAFVVLVVASFLSPGRGVSLGQARADGLLSAAVPGGDPLAKLRGGARVGMWAVQGPFAVLEIYPDVLVLRATLRLVPTVVISRADVGLLRVARGFSPSLNVFDRGGRQLDFSFRTMRPEHLTDLLVATGWLHGDGRAL